MGQLLEDENGVVGVIDDNGVSCFEDELGNFTCSGSGGDGIGGLIVFTTMMSYFILFVLTAMGP